MPKLKDRCNICNSTAWCGRQCAMVKRGLVDFEDEVLAEALTTEPPVKPKVRVKTVEPPPKVREIVNKIAEITKAARERPSAHPDCERCKWDVQIAAERMRERRSKARGKT